MNATQRAGRQAEVRTFVEERMKAVALEIMAAHSDGAYPEDLPGDLRAALGAGMLFGPTFPARELPSPD